MGLTVASLAALAVLARRAWRASLDRRRALALRPLGNRYHYRPPGASCDRIT